MDFLLGRMFDYRRHQVVWAFSEAAVLFLRGNPPAQKAIARLASKHGKGKALSILAHRLGHAVYVMLTKRQPFDEARFMATL